MASRWNHRARAVPFGIGAAIGGLQTQGSDTASSSPCATPTVRHRKRCLGRCRKSRLPSASTVCVSSVQSVSIPFGGQRAGRMPGTTNARLMMHPPHTI